MFIEQPPILYRLFFPGSLWRQPIVGKKVVYLTFDDGPIPDVTPWVLNLLAKEGVKATFFCVGDNVQKNPAVYSSILAQGHRVGNHTFNHIQGWRKWTKGYLRNTKLAAEYIQSDLFRPPHGHIRLLQYILLRRMYKIVMWDVVTRDYSKLLTGDEVFDNVKKYTRDGSILVFHDSLKAEQNMKYALAKSIPWLREQGYSFELL